VKASGGVQGNPEPDEDDDNTPPDDLTPSDDRPIAMSFEGPGEARRHLRKRIISLFRSGRVTRVKQNQMLKEAGSVELSLDAGKRIGPIDLAVEIVQLEAQPKNSAWTTRQPKQERTAQARKGLNEVTLPKELSGEGNTDEIVDAWDKM
jgi:hypothetical protein